MPRFKYKAKKISGEETEGIQEAEDRFDLARNLRLNNYILISSEPESQQSAKSQIITSVYNFILSIINRISLNERIVFSRNLSIMISSGLPLSRALSALIRQTRNKKFKQILEAVNNDIEKGDSLNEALSRHPAAFSNLFVAMIKAGERSGKLPEALNFIAQQLDRDLMLRRKVRGALMYPIIIVAAMIGIGALMLLYVVPTLISVFRELNVALPLSTRIIITTSNLIINNSFIATIGSLATAIAFIFLLRGKKGRYALDKMVLITPLFSPLVKKINSSYTTRTLSSLLSAGVEIMEAFEITENVLQNHYYKEVLKKARSEIQKGSPIAKIFMDAENLYPPLVSEMIAVGEETGQLSNMLLQLAVFYEEEVSETTKNLAVIIEPILMVLIGAVVGFFAISMIQPMYGMVGAM